MTARRAGGPVKPRFTQKISTTGVVKNPAFKQRISTTGVVKAKALGPRGGARRR